MNFIEQLELLRLLLGEDAPEESVLIAYLAIAGDKVLRRVYPFGTAETRVPPRYEMNQIQIAAYLIGKRGAEGEISHSENGVSRSYEDADVPPSLLREIVPFAAPLGKEARDAGDGA